MAKNDGRVAIVTGASRGLGLVIVRALAERGYAVVMNARHRGSLEEAARSVETGYGAAGTGGGEVVTVEGDITETGTRERLVAAAREWGGLDILVNNASELGGVGPLMPFEVPRFGRLFPVNVGAPLALTQLSMPLLANRRGLIVNITSDAAKAAYPGWGPYGATKAALELLTRTLAVELRDVGVSAVLVDPGDMRTLMHQEAFPGEDISDRPLPEVTLPFWRWLLAQTPASISGRRFAAQEEEAAWLQQV
jgi:NAD(P)-dependent dehydrogenase (short-subunit alcohol dehydrogenase family)